ncbi:uncharacterized protein LOC123886408 [Trifolium pratense]|uniref:uncharacterized protein LOC123886408 n=1 Tax=Trifolium pratense TaxID=57577 RepID=UPI001E6907AF|nr:uncharacterized protein LOC123886408 [Trifolium pratense]
MASFLLDLMKPYVAKFIDGAIAEARYVFCFTCIVKEFEEERAMLETERITIEQRVKDARQRGKDILAKVGSWEKEIDKLNQADTKTKQTCFFGLCPDCIWRYQKGKELANNLVKIKQLLEKVEKFGNIELPHPVPGIERHSTEYYISFKSRESKYKELLDALKDDKNYIIGLHGMPGTGKTALAIKVGKELKQSEQFAYVVDTTVSFTPDIEKIQDEIAGPLGLKWEDCNESDRPKKLLSRLTNGEKILVLLDDVWDLDPPLDFDAIGIPKQDNHKGCRVLVTSRSIKTFNIMDCDKRIELDVLSKEDAWIMFKSYARISNSTSKKLTDKGRQIAKQCKQLPIAISVIASSLKGQQNREHEWDVTLKSLKQPVSVHGVDDHVVGIYNCLKISYDNLKDENTKVLFLLCSVFREDEEYSVEDLTRLCIGVGLFAEDYGSYDDARIELVVAKNELVDSCLLLEDGEKSLKMHDLVRDAAQWIANKEIQCVRLFDKKEKSLVENQTNIKHLLCEGKCMDIFNLKFDGSKLETLIVKVDRDDDRKRIEVPDSFFQNVIKLRVLNFSGNYGRPLSLPDSIQSLSNIRSVLVDSVDLGDISILGNLQSLETLDLVKCKISEFPNQITKLGKFKLLKLEDCKIRKNNPFEVIERCSSLEEFYFKDSTNDFCQEITLPVLQRYHINRGGMFYSSSMEMEIINFPKYVVFHGGNDEESHFSKGTLKYCMQTAEALWLHGIKEGWRNLMPEIVPVDLGMNFLVELHLFCILQLECLIDTIGSQVPNVLCMLVVLELKEMKNMEELSNGPLSFESLNNLENLSIMDCEQLQSLFKGKLNLCNLKAITLENCPMLVSLFEVLTSRSLVLLETLKIANCERLETIIADARREDEEIDDGDNNNKSHGSMFSKLKVIDIERCHRLESILPLLSAQDIPVLETIRITECDGLKYVFDQSQNVELVSLSKLMLSKLPNFIGIFEECYDPTSSFVKGSSSTSNYGSKAQIQLDHIKCNIFSWTHICCQTRIPLASESNSYRLNIWERAQCLPIQSKILCNIKELVLIHFPKMKSVSIAPLMQLETLKIKYCDELKYIIIDTGDHNTGGNNLVKVFPKLKELYVEGCEQLEYIFGHDTNDHQNHMEIHLHFPELRSLRLFFLISFVAMCPKQYRTTFPSLGNTIIKELSGNAEHFLTLEMLQLHYCTVENIFSLSEVNVQPQLDLGLQDIELHDLPMMTCLFVGPKNSFVLKNLARIDIVRCEELKIAFSTSILRFLPQLIYITIEECKELEHIIEDDDDDLENNKNTNSSRTCFPKLEGLSVINCNKLISVLPFSVCKELPKLNVLLITEANELEEIFKSQDDHKVDIPNLKIVAFDKLPSLRYTQGNQFQAVENRYVQNCQKLTLTSASTTNIFEEITELCRISTRFDLYMNVKNLFEQIVSAETTEETTEIFENAGIEQLPSAKITEDFEVPVVNNFLYLTILPTNSKLEGSTSEKTEVATVSTISGTKNEPPIQDIEIEGTSKTNNDQDSLNDNALMKVNSNAEEQFSKGDEIIVSKSKPSLNITSPIASPFPSMPSIGDPSQKVEDLAILTTKSKIQMKQTPEADHEFVENVPDSEILPTNSKIQMKQTPEAEHEFVEKFPNLAILPTNSEELLNDQLEASTSEKTAFATVSTISGTKNEPPKQKGIEKEGVSKTNIDQVSLNDDAFMKVNSTVEEQFSKDDEIIVSKSKPSPSITSPIASQFPSVSSNGGPSQKVEDLSSSLLVKRELEELVSKNHLDYLNLPLLTDFLVKNPSVHLKDTSLPNRYKGCAYNLLAELLQFLETHSLVEVSGSRHSEFVELLQDARYFAFDKEWLDGVERRALFPEIQVSPDALEKLLHSKKQVTKDVEDLRFKIHILSQHVEDLKHQLISSEAVLESIIQQEAVLSAPIGY